MTKRIWVDIVIGVLAIVSIVIVAVESNMELSRGLSILLYAVDFIICLVFAAEFTSRLRAADDKARFMKHHGYEILAMIPSVVFLAAGRILFLSAGLRALRLIRVVRVIVVIARMGRFVRVSSHFIKRSGLLYLFIITGGIIFIGAFAALVLERGTPSAEITNFADALWWSIATVTTVGYGDVVPNTIAGRIMGMSLMVIGIGVMAALISGVSATIVESRLQKDRGDGSFKETLTAEIQDKISNIDKLSEEDVALLFRMIEALRQSKSG